MPDVREKLEKMVGYFVVPYFSKRIASHLIANGVTIPVRCKDCAYNENGCCAHSENYDDTKYRPDYFCADGERRSNEAD